MNEIHYIYFLKAELTYKGFNVKIIPVEVRGVGMFYIGKKIKINLNNINIPKINIFLTKITGHIYCEDGFIDYAKNLLTHEVESKLNDLDIHLWAMRKQLKFISTIYRSKIKL